jgi:hypothetical protein
VVAAAFATEVAGLPVEGASREFDSSNCFPLKTKPFDRKNMEGAEGFPPNSLVVEVP